MYELPSQLFQKKMLISLRFHLLPRNCRLYKLRKQKLLATDSGFPTLRSQIDSHDIPLVASVSPKTITSVDFSNKNNIYQITRRATWVLGEWEAAKLTKQAKAFKASEQSSVNGSNRASEAHHHKSGSMDFERHHTRLDKFHVKLWFSRLMCHITWHTFFIMQ